MYYFLDTPCSFLKVFFSPNPRAYPKFRRLGGVARIIIIIIIVVVVVVVATWRR